MNNGYYDAVTDVTARKVACPTCKADANEPCTYLPVRMPIPGYGGRDRSKAMARYELNGKPMSTVHGARRNVVWRIRVARIKRQESRERYAGLTKPSDNALETARMLQRFDLMEYKQLVSWFRQYGQDLFGNLDKEDGNENHSTDNSDRV